DGKPIGPSGQKRQVLANTNTGHPGRDRPKLAAHPLGRVGLEVEGFVLRRAAPHEELNATADLPRRRGPAAQESRQGQPAQGHAADAQPLPPGEPVAQPTTGSGQWQHGNLKETEGSLAVSGKSLSMA